MSFPQNSSFDTIKAVVDTFNNTSPAPRQSADEVTIRKRELEDWFEGLRHAQQLEEIDWIIDAMYAKLRR